ncbi:MULTISPECIES: STAS domain-containing protein [unclassified Sphingomonas]|uniref:STAS domain-containing protein n=1 Tax=unclassified Sphingomonas TaxID=196159 RepID=UPI001F564B27|nr:MULTISPECIES: STAS domain-containing protein [unclassified Sphingomonas]
MTLIPNQPDPGIMVDQICLPAHGTTVTAEDLKVRLVLAANFGERVTIDASSVESVGQAVLQLLIAARIDSQAAGRAFAIVNPSPAFAARISALGLNHTLAIGAEEDVEP